VRIQALVAPRAFVTIPIRPIRTGNGSRSLHPTEHKTDHDAQQENHSRHSLGRGSRLSARCVIFPVTAEYFAATRLSFRSEASCDPCRWAPELLQMPGVRGMNPWTLSIYRDGRGRRCLVRWGPVSTGSQSNPTSAGRFALNWRSTGRASTVAPDWFLRWYFNFCNREGLAFHAYALPGYLFEWGQAWMLDPTATRIQTPGTPVVIVGYYDFDAAPPWRSRAWLSTTVELPSASGTNADSQQRRP
jgi:hypothetical protein